jgi:hypothetical protein
MSLAMSLSGSSGSYRFGTMSKHQTFMLSDGENLKIHELRGLDFVGGF